MKPNPILFALLMLGILCLQPARAEDMVPKSQADQWLEDLMNNVDMSLLMRAQQAVTANWALVSSYGQEYYACLKAEGAVQEKDTPTLDALIKNVQSKGQNCRYILRSLFSQMKFDISKEELKKGLSPEYRELLKKSL